MVKTLTIDSSDTAKPKASAPKLESADKPATSKPGQNADDKPGPASSSKPAARPNADAVAKEQITEVDEETLAAVYGKVRRPRSLEQSAVLTVCRKHALLCSLDMSIAE